MGKTISYITLGCKLNYAETSTYERALTDAGLEAVSWTSGADIYLVNTCSVTEHSDKKCRNIIRKLHRLSPDAKIYVTGCYAELKGDEIRAIPGVEAVFGANEKSQVVPAIKAGIEQDHAVNGDAADDAAAADGHCKTGIKTEDNSGKPQKADFKTEDNSGKPEKAGIETEDNNREKGYFGAYSTGERTRSFLKVQDGCDFRCNYCTVPLARGGSRNEPISAIVEKAEMIAASGTKEIVITGVNTGDFGKSTGETFFDLLKALYEVDGIERYRISSIEPNLLTEEMVDWIVKGDKFLPHFHIPLQSGCDSVLKEMGRRYTTADFASKIQYIRDAFASSGKYGDKEVFFGIDVIVGFPGETDEMFEQTYNFLKDVVKPAFIHIFPYSKRAGTVAAARKDQVHDSKKTERVERLEALCSELHESFESQHRGMKAKVLFESREKGGMMSGYTENYIRVTEPYREDAIGRITEVTIG